MSMKKGSSGTTRGDLNFLLRVGPPQCLWLSCGKLSKDMFCLWKVAHFHTFHFSICVALGGGPVQNHGQNNPRSLWDVMGLAS